MAMTSDSFTPPRLDGLKILITGGFGFIGSNLAHACLQAGARVTIYDCLDPNSGGNLFNIEGIQGQVEVIRSDILNFSDVCRVIDDKEVIFNCAASTSHPFSMREPWVNADVNSKGVINLLEAARRFNRRLKFVHLGTTTQLGRLHYKPADENHPEFPTDVYSASKSVSEKYVLIYGRAYGIPVTVLRLPNVFGPRAAIHSPDFTFNNFFIGLALQGREITVFGKGEQLRNVLYIDDAVRALMMASQVEATNGEVFFVVGDEHYSVARIAEETVRHIGLGSVRHIPWPDERKVIEMGDAVFSNRKFKELVPWSPSTTLEQGLSITGSYYRDCRQAYLP
jgi:UDP-glucose 4-epimerase